MVDENHYKHNLTNLVEDARVLVRAIMNYTKMVLLRKNIVEKIGDESIKIQEELNKYVKENASIYLRYACISICAFFENPKKDISNLENFLYIVTNHIKANKITTLNHEEQSKMLAFVRKFKVDKRKYSETISKCIDLRNHRGAHNVGATNMKIDIEEPSIFELREIVMFLVNSLQEIINIFTYEDLYIGNITPEFFKEHEIKEIESILKDYGSLIVYSNFTKDNSTN